MKINIAHLYPDLLNLYGDKGNIMSLIKRLEWRNIEANVNTYSLEDEIDFADTDILFVGGGAEREQFAVCNRLKEFKSDIAAYVENEGCVLALCSGFEIMGKYYESGNDKIEGLGIIDTYTESGDSRLIGDVILKPSIAEVSMNIVGFENHSGRTYINSHKPLGEVLCGYGNNDKETDKYEGVIYKNLIASNLFGPLLPKNPELTDYIINKAITKKYNDASFVLDKLDDSYELKANEFINKRYLNK